MSNGRDANPTPRWYQHTLKLALVGSVLLWAAFYPLGWWPMTFIATAPWIVLIDRRDAEGKRFYGKLWLAGWVHWLAQGYFLVMPHWFGWIGWPVGAAYVAIYVPLFVASGRVLVHRFKLPTAIAAPVAWVAVELLRAHVITGFGMAMLPHALYRQTLLIQTADIAGGYGTSFLIVLMTASMVVAATSWNTTPARTTHAAIGVTVVAFALFYGSHRLDSPPNSSQGEPLKFALIQGSIDTIFPATQQEAEQHYRQQFEQYRDLTLRARQQADNIDLIVWPESKFPEPIYDFQQHDGETFTTWTDEQRQVLQSAQNRNESLLRVLQVIQGMEQNPSPNRKVVPMLTGATEFNPVTKTHYGSAIQFDASGQIVNRYRKMHRVMFGEYIPFGDWFPFLYQLAPSGPMTAGKKPVAMRVARSSGGNRSELIVQPSICFESTVAHLIRRQLNRLADEGVEPDVLANLTDDGWFFGSNCLDFHLACNVFRSVELRKPSVVAANTGFSAHIDGNGRLLASGPRRSTDVLVVDVIRDGRSSPYRTIGDVPAWVCVVVSLFSLVYNRFGPSPKIKPASKP